MPSDLRRIWSSEPPPPEDAPHREAEASARPLPMPSYLCSHEGCKRVALWCSPEHAAPTPAGNNRALREALERIAALPVPVEAHNHMPESAWDIREALWKCDNFFRRKDLALDLVAVIRQEAVDIARAALAPRPTPEDGTCQCAAPMTFAGKCVHCRRPTPEEGR